MIWVALIAAGIALGGWAAIRVADARHETDADIARYVISIPVEDLDADRWRWDR